MWKQFNGWIVLFILSFFLSACSNEATNNDSDTEMNNDDGTSEAIEQIEEEPKYGGIYNILTAASPPMLDPHLTSSYYTHNILGLVYSKLITYETGPNVNYSDYNLVPDLAQDWDVSEDGTVYTFYLRDNAKWHNIPPVNGRNVDAHDVVATFERIMSLQSHQAFMVSKVEKIETPDDLTVEFHLTEPFSPFLSYMANHFMWILPKEGVEGKFDLETSAIGSGPFILDTWVKDVESKFSRNPDYFLEGLPYLDGIEYLVVPDEDTRLAAFRSGQTDGSGLVSPEQLENLLRSNPDITVTENLYFSPHMLFFNMTREPFDNLLVRKAISMAIDRQNAVNQIYGSGEIGSPVNPTLGDWALPLSERERLQPYDVEQAKQLLDEAGYPDGFSTSLQVTTAYGEQVIRMAQWIIEDLKEIGIEAELEILDYATFFGHRWPNLEYDFIFTFQTPFQEADEWLYVQHHTNGSRNWMGISDPDLDEMIEEQSKIFDMDERIKMVHDIQKYILEEVVNPVPVFNHNVITPYQPWIKNSHPHASYGNLHYKEIWLDR